jgi:putative ATPase
LSDLFEARSEGKDSPLADRMRPRTLDEVVGQDHIVGAGRLLRRSIQADRISSIILYGPPGTGKTSLARVVANTTKSSFESLNAVLCGVKDVREAIERATERRRLYGKEETILLRGRGPSMEQGPAGRAPPWVENGTSRPHRPPTTERTLLRGEPRPGHRSRIFQLKA